MNSSPRVNPRSIPPHLPRLRDVFFFAICAGIMLMGPRLFHMDGDLGRHITIGNVILEQRHIPTTDMFSHTMKGEPLTPHEWLAQVSFALAHGWLGLDGVVILSASILALAFTLLYQELVRTGVNPLLAILLSLFAAAVSSVHFLARPHIFTILFLASWTPIVMRLERGEDPRGAYLLPLIMLVWVNTHGAFIAGFVVWGAALAGAVWEWTRKRLPLGPIKRLTAAGTASALAVLINPSGVNVVETSLGYLQNDYLVGHTQEYLPPNFHNSGFLPFLILLSVMIYCLGIGWKRLRPSEALLAAGWTAMSLYSARNIPLFAIVVTPILAPALETGLGDIKGFAQIGGRLRQMETSARGFLWPILLIAALAAISMGGLLGSYNSYRAEVFPVQAMDWLETNPQEGNMFNYFTWGGYILYRGWPQNLVFIDGQTDFYGEALTREYEQVITRQNGWEAILKKYDVNWTILPLAAPLNASLLEAGWTILYEDETAVILRAPR